MSSHRSPRSRAVAAVLAVLMVSSLFAVGAPSAGAIEVVPAPPGWSGGGSTSSGNSAKGGEKVTTDCASGRAFVNGRLFFENWPGCRTFRHNGRTYTWTIGGYGKGSGKQYFCSHAMEVWRFYGTRANPTQVRTVSRTNLNPCHTTVAPLVHDGHPEDSSRTPYLGITNPYRQGTAFGSPLVGVQASVSTIGSHDVGQAFVFTTNWPFRRNGWCNSLMSRDPNPMKGQQYSLTADAWRKISARWGRWWADVALDRVGGTHASPVFGNNNIDCSSGPVDFAVAAQEGVPYEKQQNVRVSGYCAIPLWREHALTRNPVTGETWYAAMSPSAVAWAGTPEVYSQYYGQGSTGRPSTPENNRILQAMRTSVADEVLTRPGKATTPGLYPEDKTRPPWASADNPNLFLAAIVAAAFSHCNFSLSNTYPGDGTRIEESTEEKLPGDKVRLYVEVPQAGQVGGAHRPATIRTRLARGGGGSEVRCGDGWCPVKATGPRLKSVNLDTSQFLTAPDGAKEHDDYRVLQALRPDARTGTADGTGSSLRLAFFKATAPNAPYRLHIGPSSYATIEGEIGSDRTVTTCEPFGGPCRTHTITKQRTVTKQVPVEVVYVRNLDTLEKVPPEFPVVGATATPIEGRGN